MNPETAVHLLSVDVGNDIFTRKVLNFIKKIAPVLHPLNVSTSTKSFKKNQRRNSRK